jgi:hypothetical protein
MHFPAAPYFFPEGNVKVARRFIAGSDQKKEIRPGGTIESSVMAMFSRPSGTKLKKTKIPAFDFPSGKEHNSL